MPFVLWMSLAASLLAALLNSAVSSLLGQASSSGWNASAGIAGAWWQALLVAVLLPAVVEELFFRGFLLRYLLRYGAIPAVLLSSAVFGLFHLVNWTAGSALYTWAQVLCAFAAGICFAAAAVRSGSLLPGFAAHLLSNLTAAPAPVEPHPLLWFCIALYGCYGAALCKSLSVNKERKI